MLPATAPIKPMEAAVPKPWLAMKATTTSPMPNAVPKLVRDTSWYFLKYLAKETSLDRLIIAGLSDKKVSTAPKAATPGRLYKGRIKGRRIASKIDTTPNSPKRRPSALVNTHIAIR